MCDNLHVYVQNFARIRANDGVICSQLYVFSVRVYTQNFEHICAKFARIRDCKYTLFSSENIPTDGTILRVRL